MKGDLAGYFGRTALFYVTAELNDFGQRNGGDNDKPRINQNRREETDSFGPINPSNLADRIDSLSFSPKLID
ncbi:hypothetical protein EHV15_20090 [Paenibacillus oralis]|uniref:Uncharacterized protein n=1 Tax=Paenibacillus oralis TaxID=2490856 RepID=A0A3P3U3N3_9BACL|nr:hypothetical protein [Paenibacillus oralis]RRJ64962.1 hypothetical protein EHV15_20090 [Paenibacillus oralis]